MKNEATTKTKAPRLTTLEQRAKRWTDEFDTSEVFSIEWRPSAMYGNTAVICDSYGDKAAAATGCGYDKESLALADFLQFLCPSAAHKGGFGFSSIEAAVIKDGYTIFRLARARCLVTFVIRKTA